MAFDVNNFVIDRPIRGIMTNTSDGSVLWSLSQIGDPSLSISSDTVDVLDAIGGRIAQYDRAKNAELSGTNAIFDLSLAAAQFGTEKKIGSVSSKIITPRFDTLIYKTGDTIGSLSKVPVGTAGAEIPFIYVLKGDSTLGQKYKIGATADADTFELDAATKEITYPTGLTDGTEIFVMYDYEEENAVEVVNSATEFPRAGKFILTVLGNDVCDPSTKYYAHIIFPNAKLSATTEIPLSAGTTVSFTITAMQGKKVA